MIRRSISGFLTWECGGWSGGGWCFLSISWTAVRSGCLIYCLESPPPLLLIWKKWDYYVWWCWWRWSYVTHDDDVWWQDWREFLSDGLHLSQRGSRYLFDVVWPLVETRTAHLPLILPAWRDVNADCPDKSLLDWSPPSCNSDSSHQWLTISVTNHIHLNLIRDLSSHSWLVISMTDRSHVVTLRISD